MKPLLRLASIAAVVVALGAPASAQIISTSLPKMTPGEEHKKFSAHFMITPLAKWDYSEVYIDDVASKILITDGISLPVDFTWQTQGAMSAGPYSKFMVAGEFAFVLGDSDWSLVVGGWYNKLGSHDFDLAADQYASVDVTGDQGSVNLFQVGAPLKARIKVDFDMYEGHFGVFYKSFGVQGGFVRTEPRASEPTDVTWGGIPIDNASVGDNLRPPALAPIPPTNDWFVHGVFRKSTRAWGVSVGLGAYVLKGVTTGVLRFPHDQTLLSTFATGSVKLFGPVSLDASVWYLASTAEYADYKNDVESRVPVCTFLGEDCSAAFDSTPLKLPSGINKSRLTVGIGFGF
jgi:hypothetical protein